MRYWEGCDICLHGCAPGVNTSVCVVGET